MKISCAPLSLLITIGLLILATVLLASLRREHAQRVDAEQHLKQGIADQDLLALRIADLEERLAARPAVYVGGGGTTPTSSSDDGDAAEADDVPVDAPDPTTIEQRELELAGLDEAQAQVMEALERGDLEALWLLGAELLKEGEPGYEKIIALIGDLDEHRNLMERFGLLWRAEELYAGRFLQEVDENLDDLLRFGLYVTGKRGELPRAVEGLRDEFTDEMGAVLLGYYDGDDPELLGDFVSFYRQRLVGEDLGSMRHADEMIRAVGQIPTEGATDVLLDVLAEARGPVLIATVQALAWQRSDRALSALQDLLPQVSDSRSSAVIEAAIDYLRE